VGISAAAKGNSSHGFGRGINNDFGPLLTMNAREAYENECLHIKKKHLDEWTDFCNNPMALIKS
jgi:hypothetical protein